MSKTITTNQSAEIKSPTHDIITKEILDKITTREELKEALEKVNHPLHALSQNTVFSSPLPDKHPEIMVIGEAPGEEEDKQGLPFVGASGQLIEQIFNSIGLSRKHNIYISNIIPWRPPGNRTPTTEEIASFRPYILKHIQIMQPKLLILVGATSYKAIVGGKEAISNIRGNFIDHPTLHIPCLVVFHPSYLLRAPSAKKIMWQDMLKLKKWLLEQKML